MDMLVTHSGGPGIGPRARGQEGTLMIRVIMAGIGLMFIVMSFVTPPWVHRQRTVDYRPVHAGKNPPAICGQNQGIIRRNRP